MLGIRYIFHNVEDMWNPRGKKKKKEKKKRRKGKEKKKDRRPYVAPHLSAPQAMAMLAQKKIGQDTLDGGFNPPIPCPENKSMRHGKIVNPPGFLSRVCSSHVNPLSAYAAQTPLPNPNSLSDFRSAPKWPALQYSPPT